MNNLVIFPTFPLPIFFLSILIIGVISAAVPERKISSANFNSFLLTFRSLIFKFKYLAKVITDLRVIPSNAYELSGGVINSSFFTRNMFSPGASLTLPD